MIKKASQTIGEALFHTQGKLVINSGKEATESRDVRAELFYCYHRDYLTIRKIILQSEFSDFNLKIDLSKGT